VIRQPPRFRRPGRAGFSDSSGTTTWARAWQPSDLRRTAASYTLQEGLVTVLGADDNFEQFRDHDFNDLVLRCRNLDPELNPRIPLFNTPDFTLPVDVRDNCPKAAYDAPYGYKHHDHPGYKHDHDHGHHEGSDKDYVEGNRGQDRGRDK
jgi:hypothetical protein